jgi:hypothetical protein
MTRTFYNQTPQALPARLPGKEQPQEAARKSIERVDIALDKVFADAKAALGKGPVFR